MRTPSTTASDFDSCRGATATANRPTPFLLQGVISAATLLTAILLFASTAMAGKGIVGSSGTGEPNT
jgi:hypothetical protein